MKIDKKLLDAAEKGNSEAQYAVAARLASDGKSEQELNSAFGWYKKASEKKHAEATYNLALMFMFGEGCETNQQKGKRLMRKAAKQGSIDANQYLAEVYLKGLQGFNKNASLGVMYLICSLRLGNTRAIRDLEELLNTEKITLAQLEKGLQKAWTRLNPSRSS